MTSAGGSVYLAWSHDGSGGANSMGNEVNVRFQLEAKVTASGQLRYSFTAQFLRGAARFTALARAIEEQPIGGVDEDSRSDHLAYVAGAVMQSCAAIEAEIAEVVEHGPGHHLGSNGLDQEGLKFLQPLADAIDGQSALDRYQLVLHLLRKAQFDNGGEPFQSTALLVRLRNAITHYRSKWGPDMDEEKLFKSMRHLRLARPPFIPENTNFFPHQCLGADCAAWAVRTAAAFIDDFYVKMGIASPLVAHRTRILNLLS
jgi:hypothetical protein